MGYRLVLPPCPLKKPSYGNHPVVIIPAVNPKNYSVNGVFASLLLILLISLVFTLDRTYHTPLLDL
jgi:hypothetical protein